MRRFWILLGVSLAMCAIHIVAAHSAPPAAISPRAGNPTGRPITCIWRGEVLCLFWGGEA